MYRRFQNRSTVRAEFADLSYPLPAGITNYGIALKVYGSVPGSGGRNENIELPDYEEAAKLMATRKNMTLMFLWNRYKKKCEEEGTRFYCKFRSN